ncbi:MAG: protein kinase [Anaerolineae bacterium]|nr:protein kinase [Anaerolineae bacterium]
MALLKNTILENRYQIESLLSQGGMGAIYRAFDTNLKTPVAIKENFFQTAHSIQQFEQEALILARLRHPGLPRVIHHFSFNRKQYLVMDFIEGENLWEMVQKQGQPLEEAQALTYLLQVCDAVSYLHHQDPPILHRDIKPQNIKITPEGEAMLVDFGIAKVAKSDSRTGTGAMAFTPGFSPPEQYTGSGTTVLSDVYALGATLYAVLVGKKPPDSISRMVGNANYKAPHLLNPKLSGAVSATIEHAMQIKPEYRSQSVEAWQKELESVLAGTATAVIPSGITADQPEEPTLQSALPLDDGVLDAENPPFSSVALSPPEKDHKRNRPLWLGAAATLIVFAIGFMAFAPLRSDPPTQTVSNEGTTVAALATATRQALATAEAVERTNAEATISAALTVAARQKAVEAATKQAQATPTATPTPVPPTATNTATSSPPTATALPSFTAETGANLRSGPGTAYERVGELAAGANVEIIGRNEDSSWWQVSYPEAPDGVAWLAATLGTATETASVALATALPPPTPVPSVPTPQDQVERILSPTMFEFLNMNCTILNETVLDQANDISSPATDIVQVNSNFSGETLTVSFTLRDLPETLTFHRPGVDNHISEYEWAVYIDADADQATGILYRGIDYILSAEEIVFDATLAPYDLPIIDGVQAKLTACEDNGACNTVDATLTVEPEANRLTLTAVVPGLTSESRLEYQTTDYFTGFDFAVCPAN